MNKSTTITQKGQVTIPVDVRRHLQLTPGESVRFRVLKNKQVVLEKNDWEKRFGKLQKQIADHLKKHQIPVLSDAKLQKLIDESAEQAALERYMRSIED